MNISLLWWPRIILTPVCLPLSIPADENEPSAHLWDRDFCFLDVVWGHPHSRSHGDSPQNVYDDIGFRGTRSPDWQLMRKWEGCRGVSRDSACGESNQLTIVLQLSSAWKWTWEHFSWDNTFECAEICVTVLECLSSYTFSFLERKSFPRDFFCQDEKKILASDGKRGRKKKISPVPLFFPFLQDGA